MIEVVDRERENSVKVDVGSNELLVKDVNIHRNKTSLALYNTEEVKRFRFTFDKRIVDWDNYTTKPYGYRPI